MTLTLTLTGLGLALKSSDLTGTCLGKPEVKVTPPFYSITSTIQNRPNLPTCYGVLYTDLTVCSDIAWDRDTVLSGPPHTVKRHLLAIDRCVCQAFVFPDLTQVQSHRIVLHFKQVKSQK